MSKPSSRERQQLRQTELKAIELLERYDCPMEYHAICTYFLGAMCSPTPVQPMKVLAHLWDGALPVMPDLDAVNELLGTLVHGLWNALTVHQETDRPYRLMKPPRRASRPSVAFIAKVREEELEGFLHGIFGDGEDLQVPGPMAQALENLMQMSGMFAGICELLADSSKPASAADLQGLMDNIAKLTAIAETEMHDVVMEARMMREGDGAMQRQQSSPRRTDLH
jgi:hypothetical protein